LRAEVDRCGLGFKMSCATAALQLERDRREGYVTRPASDAATQCRHKQCRTNDSDVRLSALIKARDAAGDEALERRLAIDRLATLRAKAESGARRLLKNTARQIEAIEAKHTRPGDQRNERYIRHRHLLAECHLKELPS
jgi:hypothetical protein